MQDIPTCKRPPCIIFPLWLWALVDELSGFVIVATPLAYRLPDRGANDAYLHHGLVIPPRQSASQTP